MHVRILVCAQVVPLLAVQRVAGARLQLVNLALTLFLVRLNDLDLPRAVGDDDGLYVVLRRRANPLAPRPPLSPRAPARTLYQINVLLPA